MVSNNTTNTCKWHDIFVCVSILVSVSTNILKVYIVMSCLFITDPLSQTLLTYCQLNPAQQTWSKLRNISFKTYICKCATFSSVLDAASLTTSVHNLISPTPCQISHCGNTSSWTTIRNHSLNHSTNTLELTTRIYWDDIAELHVFPCSI